MRHRKIEDYKNGKCRKKVVNSLVENVVKILMKMKWFLIRLLMF